MAGSYEPSQKKHLSCITSMTKRRDGKIGNEEDITDKTLIYYVREIEHQIDELLSEEKDC